MQGAWRQKKAEIRMQRAADNIVFAMKTILVSRFRLLCFQDSWPHAPCDPALKSDYLSAGLSHRFFIYNVVGMWFNLSLI